VNDRFKNLTKVPSEPAAKIMAQNNVTLQTTLDAPASAPVDVVLDELAAKGADVDILRMMSVLLPPRERVWWACLAARDIVGEGPENETPSLRAAEAWVFRPTEENRESAIASMDHAPVDDDTVYCAMSVMYADGSLGTGALAEHDAPTGGSAVAAFAMNVEALGHRMDRYDSYVRDLVDRALDIARGGKGRPDDKPGRKA